MRLDAKDFPLLPGVYKEAAASESVARWTKAERIRWRIGQAGTFFALKIGGWAKQTSTVFLGTCRKLHHWVSLAGDRYVGLGTHLKLYIYADGSNYDVTPYRLATDAYGGAEAELTNPFTTQSSGSPLVDVAHTSHGLEEGDYVHFTCTSATFDGVTISGEYSVTSVTSNNAYVITAGQNATAGSVNGGGTVDYGYEINIGVDNSTPGLGWGAGPWGDEAWGDARTASAITFDARVWSIVNWGEDMIAAHRGGKVYHWDATNGLSTRATLITNAPSQVNALVMATDSRTLVALGAHDGSVFDPMLVRWCDTNDFTTWTPSVNTNTAGDKRLDSGTEIIGGVAAGREIVISTNLSLYSMYYVGPTDIYGFDHVGVFGGAASPNAMVPFPGGVIIFGINDFYLYDGRLRALPCDIHGLLFHTDGGYDRDNAFKVYGWHNVDNQEVWWFYPSASGGGASDRYVYWNYVDNYWGEGPMARTAAVMAQRGVEYPLATGTDNYVYAHEIGVDDDGSGMDWSMESYFAQRPDAEHLIVSRLIPRFNSLSGSIAVTIKGKAYPQSSAVKSKGPYTVTSATRKISPRMKAKLLQLTLSGDGVGQQFEMGTWQTAARGGSGRRGQ